MRGRWQLVSLLLVVLAASPAFAADAGTLPNSPLYFFDTLQEGMALFFTGDPMARARLQLEIAEERVAECEALTTSFEKEKFCPALMSRYQELVNSTLEILNTTRTQSASFAGLVENQTARHIQVLQGLLAKVPETVRPALQRAINLSQLAQPPPLRQVLIGEISKTVESLEVKERIARIVENATRTGNFTEATREELRRSLTEELAASSKDIESIVLTRVEAYVRERGTTDIRDILEAVRRRLTTPP